MIYVYNDLNPVTVYYCVRSVVAIRLTTMATSIGNFLITYSLCHGYHYSWSGTIDKENTTQKIHSVQIKKCYKQDFIHLLVKLRYHSFVFL